MKIRIVFAQLLLILMLFTAAVMADGLASPSGIDLSWKTIDSGGGKSTGPSLELHGTIGQPDAGATLVGGNLELNGGFWPASVEPVNTCLADIAGDDGLVDIDDLLLVINFWGQGAGAPGDVNLSGSVNIDDLLLIINAWGVCP